MELEVCIDNLESLRIAQHHGATRIELCSALSLGGLTPSQGMMHRAAKIANVPVYAMIRPRQGDFIFDDDDIASMLEDVYAAQKAELQGIVIGCLYPNGDIHKEYTQALIKAAGSLDVTFHRAIDQTHNLYAALDGLMSLGVTRVLTSGQKGSAIEGVETIKKMVSYCKNHLSIMAGAGVSPDNARQLLATGIRELHLSGKQFRPSTMTHRFSLAQMGNVDDFEIPVTNGKVIREMAHILMTSR